MTAPMAETAQVPWRTLAANLCRSCDLPEPARIKALAGGKNNRVFELGFEDGRSVVLKKYHHDPRDGRDRLGAEWAFLRYAAERGITNVPQGLAKDDERHAALYTFAQGTKLKPVNLGNVHVAHAMAFIHKLNVDRRNPMALPPGSEACFSLQAHIATVDRRVARLGTIDVKTGIASDAAKFVSHELTPVWGLVRETLLRSAREAGIGVTTELQPQEMCISPSDFGFHNALVDREGRISFIDFEYAGRDDPAKLISDFFCQPEIPVPLVYHAAFVDILARALGLGQAHRDRCAMLLDAYRVKWICIMLNDFLPVGAARRAFAAAGEQEQRCAGQLAKARRALEQVAKI